MPQRFILCIGAHPDDNEFSVGGTAARFRARGDEVRFVSVTNGDRGHYLPEYAEDRSQLSIRRQREAQEAAAVAGASFQTLGAHDGEVYVDRDNTEAMVRCIRSFGPPGAGPDLVLFNRPQDYHRDHRYTSQLVLDATYMLTVPLMCPRTRHLDRMPVFAYWYDDFAEVTPFRPDVVVATDEVIERKIDMLCAHASQVFEWLPYNAGKLGSVPPETDTASRREWVAQQVRFRDARRRERVAEASENWDCSAAHYVEAFQICEYGRRPEVQEIRDIFFG